MKQHWLGIHLVELVHSTETDESGFFYDSMDEVLAVMVTTIVTGL